MGVPRGVYTNYGRSTRTVSTNNNSYAADQDTAEDFGTDATEYEEFSVLTSSVFGDKFGLVFSGVNAYMQEHMQSRTGVLFGARAPYVFQNSRTLVVCWRPTFNHFGLLSAGEKAKCEAYMEAYNAQLRRILVDLNADFRTMVMDGRTDTYIWNALYGKYVGPILTTRVNEIYERMIDIAKRSRRRPLCARQLVF